MAPKVQKRKFECISSTSGSPSTLSTYSEQFQKDKENLFQALVDKKSVNIDELSKAINLPDPLTPSLCESVEISILSLKKVILDSQAASASSIAEMREQLMKLI
jgi:hypothetical protein